ncbi:hypothetical protein BBP40_004302 [Aspergillus hancockii]|nr:hypothetical protein BBP40_004302 [Aspergillus hancockii]
MLQRTLKVITLALWVAVLSCLLVVYIGCTSTSLRKANQLFFIKVDFNDFPKLDHWKLARASGLPGGDVSSAADGTATSFSHASDTAQAKIDGAEEHLQDISNELKSRLPDSLAVGLLGYCEETQDRAFYARCSRPDISFSFDLVNYLGTGAEKVVPVGAQKVLEGYQQASKWAVSAYILGSCATLLAIALLIVSGLESKKVIIVSIVGHLSCRL